MSVNSTSSASSSGSLSLAGISGYDFSGIVGTLVQAYKLPETQMITQQTELQTKKNAWQDVNTRLSSLDNTLTALKDLPTWSATQGTSSNTALLGVTTGINAVQGQYNVRVFNIAQTQTAISTVQNVSSATAATSVLKGSFSITVGGNSQTINVSAGDSLQTIANSINNAKAGVNASVVQVSGGYQLAITDSKTGLANAASFADVSNNVLQTLGVLDSTNKLNTSQDAKDAVISINGITNITSASNTVTGAIPGVTLNVNGADNGASTISVNITADSSAAQKAIQAFVDQYNSTMSFIKTNLSYDSTTKISGDLFGDPVLQGIQARLRNITGGTLNNPTGTFNDLSAIGVTTSSANYGEDAKLSFDSTKFAAAMASDPQSVANLLGASVGTVNLSNGDASPAQGLANIMDSYLHPMIMYGGTMDRNQNSYDTQLINLKNQIAAFEKKATAYQNTQNAKFAALETALAGINSQGSWLTAQINAMSSSSTST